MSFFAQAKMDKDVRRAKDKEELEKITNDANATEEQRTQAYERMLKLLENSDKEMRIEALIKNKGLVTLWCFSGMTEALMLW